MNKNDKNNLVSFIWNVVSFGVMTSELGHRGLSSVY